MTGISEFMRNHFKATDFDQYVFIDCETSGLNINYNDLIDVSWAVGLGEIKTLRISRSEFTSIVVNEWFDPQAFKINGYDQFVIKHTDGLEVLNYPEISRAEVIEQSNELYHDLKGRTLVGANPAFDARFIAKFLGSRDMMVDDNVVRQYSSVENEPWHHRLFDISAVFGGWIYGSGRTLPVPFGTGDYEPWVPPLLGLNKIAKYFKDLGYPVDEQKQVHTSASDTEIVRAAFLALIEEQRSQD